MNKFMAAVTLAIAVPGVAHAQATPAGKPSVSCCQEMTAKCAEVAGNPASASGAHSPDPNAAHGMKPAAPVGGHSKH